MNENVQITHDRLITLENRAAMMAKAIIPVLKDFKAQNNNTNNRLIVQYHSHSSHFTFLVKMAPDCIHNTTGLAFIATQEFPVTYCLTFVFFILFVVPFRVHSIDISQKLLRLNIFTSIFVKTFCIWNIIIGLYWAAHECGRLPTCIFNNKQT